MKKTITPFGAAIRRERQKRSLSQRDVARATGISAPYMNQMETNKFVPDPFYVVRVARYFGIEPVRMLRLALPRQFALWAKAFGWSAPKRGFKTRRTE
jgi:transcriptional regulator with XRE-family HTH domain